MVKARALTVINACKHEVKVVTRPRLLDELRRAAAIDLFSIGRTYRNRQAEGGTLTGPTLGPDGATMSLCRVLDNG